MDFSLELKKTGLHAEKIITLRLFEIGVSAAQHKLPRLEVIVRVILVRD
ncbi:hypothetical protein IMSAG025_01026 [Muribaculaceae bacterium]|nr:hypothetical protein IMSAG025_01026 [Muribaculaceae bacterium]